MTGFPGQPGWIERLDAWLTPRRVRMYPAAMLALTLALFAQSLLGARGWTTRDGRAIGEDYLAFFMAGEMVRSGSVHDLYDLAAQESWQREFMAARSPQWHGTCLYLNPPHYAWAMSWITGWGYGLSLAAWWALALGCFAATVWIWRGWVSAQNLPTAVLVAISMPAWFQALAGGQNSFVSLLILSGFCALLMRGRDLLAGCVLALLAFKFQLLIVPALLLLYQRRWRAVGGVLLGGFGLTALTAATLGTDALGNYLRFGAELSRLLQLEGFDVYKQHSWHGFFALLGHGWLLPQSIRILTGTFVLATLAVLVSIWRGPWTAQRLPLVLSATIVASLLVSPHLFHYDLVILALPAVLWLGSDGRMLDVHLHRRFRVLLAVGFGWLAISPMLADALRVQLSPWLMLAWLGVALRAARTYAGMGSAPAMVQASDDDECRSAAIETARESPHRHGACPRPAGNPV